MGISSMQNFVTLWLFVICVRDIYKVQLTIMGNIAEVFTAWSESKRVDPTIA